VRMRPDGQAMAVFSPPWWLFDSGDIRNAPVRVHGIEHQRQIDSGAVWGTLSPARIRALAARHEAGHGVMYTALKIPTAGVELDGRAQGHTRFGSDEEQPFPYLVAGHLAGLAAGQLWLEHEGLASPGSYTVCDLQSANDHALLFAVTAPCKLVFSYGARAEGRMPVRAGADLLEVEIEPMIKAARYLLHDAWDAVSMLAEHLLAHGSAGPQQLASLPSGRLTPDEIDDLLDAGMRGSAREIPAVGDLRG